MKNFLKFLSTHLIVPKYPPSSTFILSVYYPSSLSPSFLPPSSSPLPPSPCLCPPPPWRCPLFPSASPLPSLPLPISPSPCPTPPPTVLLEEMLVAEQGFGIGWVSVKRSWGRKKLLINILLSNFRHRSIGHEKWDVLWEAWVVVLAALWKFSPYYLFIPKIPSRLNAFYTFIIFLSSSLPPLLFHFHLDTGSALQISKLSLYPSNLSSWICALCTDRLEHNGYLVYPHALVSLRQQRSQDSRSRPRQCWKNYNSLYPLLY